MKNSSIKKHIMWHKINELNSKGFNKSQISRHLDLDRGTVRKYLKMSESEFLSSSTYKRDYSSKLDPYRNKIISYLEFCQDLSSSQIHDRLKEDFINLPTIHPNTVVNYVARLRIDENLPKIVSSTRDFNKLDETSYGEYAQVDFGERWVYTGRKRTVKVYFMAIVLCRSRYKFIYFQSTPFTTKSSIYAHELAFEYFGGIPQKIIYDQDKVFIHRENLGDYLLTKDFRSFVNKHHFETIFCKKNDPQSKGKVENVVKYVKNNFLKGRPYNGIGTLNSQALLWLSRTGNGIAHYGTKLIPSVVFAEEKKYLQSYYGTPKKEVEMMKEYTVRIDNTVHYLSNFYTLPLGTYVPGKANRVYLSLDGSNIHLYNKETGKIIVTHSVSNRRGQTISNPEHRRRDQTSIKQLERKIISHLGGSAVVESYLLTISNTYPRYYKDSLKHLYKHMSNYKVSDIITVMTTHINTNIFNCNSLINTLSNMKDSNDNDCYNNSIDSSICNTDLTPDKRDINQYNNFF